MEQLKRQEVTINKSVEYEDIVSYRYDSEEERDNHIVEMRGKGYTIDESYSNNVFPLAIQFRKFWTQR